MPLSNKQLADRMYPTKRTASGRVEEPQAKTKTPVFTQGDMRDYRTTRGKKPDGTPTSKSKQYKT